MRILIIEDDPVIGDGLAVGLQSSGFAVDWFRDGQQGDSAVKTVAYDCVVLDLGLPGKDGMAWLKRWRDEGKTMPVIVLTARDAEDSRVTGLDSGADDYLIKPISVRELASRIRAVTRRSAGQATALVRHGVLELDTASKNVSWRGEPVTLTSRELVLLELFLQHPSRVLSKPQIIQNLYSWGDEVEGNAIEVFIHNLRRKTSPELVRTVRGLGYALGPAQH